MSKGYYIPYSFQFMVMSVYRDKKFLILDHIPSVGDTDSQLSEMMLNLENETLHWGSIPGIQEHCMRY